MQKFISPLGILFVIGYAGGILLCRYYSWHCTGQNCVYVLVIPFLPWAIWLEPLIMAKNAVFIYALIAAVNGSLAYGCGWLTQRMLIILFRRIAHVLKSSSKGF